MSSKEKILNQLLTLKFATINNFFSRSASTVKGSRLQVYYDFRELEKKGLIRPIPYDELARNRQIEQFYQITYKGAKSIGRLEEYSQKEVKAIANIKHESAKIDIAMSFLLGYPDYAVDFDYNASIDGYRPDILVRMSTPDLKKKYTFIVEIERKQHPGRTYEEKIKKIEKVLAKLNYRKYGLTDHTKVLIVWNNMSFNPFWRPQEYGNFKGQKEVLERHFELLLEICKNLPSYRYRFIPFSEFANLHKPVWHTPSGERMMLINN